MSVFSRILVPLDGSPLSERALPLAREIIRRSGGSIHLVRVHVPPRIPATCHQVLGPRVGAELKRSRVEAREHDREYLNRARKPASPSAGSEVSTALLRGPEGLSVVDEVRRSQASLVVMSVPVPGRDAPDHLDGQRDTVVRHCPTPVLVVRSDETSTDARASTPARLLVPLDGTRRSESVLEPAAAVARLFDVPMTLLRVVTGEGRVGGERPGDGTVAKERDYLEGLVEGAALDGVKAETRVESADPVEAILGVAAEENTDLIAMTSRCRGPLTRMVLGSVSDRVLRRTSASVLVANPVRA